MFDNRFRDVHRFARAAGYLSGFSTLEQGFVHNSYLEYQAVLIPHLEGVIFHSKSNELGNPSFNELSPMFRAAHRFARNMGYRTGFPTFEQGRDENNERIFPIVALRDSIADIRSVPASELGSVSFSDERGMVIAAHRYARNHGFVSGFSLFEQGRQDGVLHYGIALINSAATFLQLPADVLLIPGSTGVNVLDMQGLVVFNNSDSIVYAKDENGSTVRQIKPGEWAVDSVDGVATKNQSKGRVAKTPDLNIVYITKDGDVRSWGPRQQAPFFGVEPIWLNEPPTEDPDGWKDIFDISHLFDPPEAPTRIPEPPLRDSGGRLGSERPERHGVIHDAPDRDRELASRTA